MSDAISIPFTARDEPSPTAETSAASIEPDRCIGAHMPTAGGLYKSLLAGREIGCSAVQLFTANPRQWVHPSLATKDIESFHAAREQTGIPFAVAHDSYLINLAAPSAEIMEKSRNAFRGELDRAQQLGLSWVVTHMGAHLDQGEDAALARLAESLKHVLDDTDAAGYTTGIALETTAGQGTGLGWRFEQLGWVLDAVGSHPRLGVCLDTCHIFAAGYDLRTEAEYERTWAAFEANVGISRLKLIHANDAKKPLGSRVDRHEHIGAGEIGLEAFARLMTDPRLQSMPVLVETPDSDTMHAMNVALLRRLAAGVPDTIRITVHLFGHYQDYFGGVPLELSVAHGTTIGEVAAILAGRDPRLADLERHCRFAVNEEYVDLELALLAEGTVAVLPPMSGG